MNTKKQRIERAASRAMALLRRCRMCPRRCGVNRVAGERGFCGAGVEATVCYRNLLYGEEPAISPSYELFLSGCNMRCSFCYVDGAYRGPMVGEPLSTVVPAVEREFTGPRSAQARTLSVLGGEPSVNLPAVLAFLSRLEPSPEVVWNTNVYVGPVVPRLLEGVVDHVIADLHFGNDNCAEELAGTPGYFGAATRALTEFAARTEVTLRCLLVPGHLECCFLPIVRWLAGNHPEMPLHILGNYRSRCGQQLDPREHQMAVHIARAMGVRIHDPDAENPPAPARSRRPRPIADEEIIVEAGGRVTIPHLTGEMLGLALALDPDHPELQRRAAWLPREES